MSSRQTFERETAGLPPDPGIKAQPAKQGEFSLAMHSYVGEVVNPRRSPSAAPAQACQSLANIESRHGVPSAARRSLGQRKRAPAPMRMAYNWRRRRLHRNLPRHLGRPSGYGPTQGGHDILRSVATLAVRKHRVDFYRDEFVAALVLLQNGMPRANLTGSERRDEPAAVHRRLPEVRPSAIPAAASPTSGAPAQMHWLDRRFLKGSGWADRLPAVIGEVTVPGNFDWKPVDLDLSQWHGLGFSRADGEALPSAGAASLYLPGRRGGPAFTSSPRTGHPAVQHVRRLCAGGRAAGRPDRRLLHGLRRGRRTTSRCR
ncbi:MAG: lytic murein transglycosylase [Rhodoblastus sp.]